ncbi:MAG: hypothetical protein H0V92_11595 [Pseudonocardiales bacterium]|nr:hypothetical protein [Pseudonocardiales bacterium]
MTFLPFFRGMADSSLAGRASVVHQPSRRLRMAEQLQDALRSTSNARTPRLFEQRGLCHIVTLSLIAAIVER